MHLKKKNFFATIILWKKVILSCLKMNLKISHKLTLQGLGGGSIQPPYLHFFTLLLNCLSVDNGTLWLFLNIIKKHCDSKIFSLYPMGVTWRHHFEQQLDGAKICKFQLFMLCAYLRNKQVYFEIIACKTKTIINVWLLIISGNDYVIMTSSG